VVELAGLDPSAGAWHEGRRDRDIAGFYGTILDAPAAIYVRDGGPRIWLDGSEWPLDEATHVSIRAGARRNVLTVTRGRQTFVARYRRPWRELLVRGLEEKIYAGYPVFWSEVDFGVFLATRAQRSSELLEIWPFTPSHDR
jgi:hypothetical protein